MPRPMTRQLVMHDPMVVIERDGWTVKRVLINDVEIPGVSRVAVFQDAALGSWVELKIQGRATIADREQRAEDAA